MNRASLIRKDYKPDIKEGEWDIVIQPRNKLLQLNLKEVWRYKDLMLLFVRRDFVAQFKQTVLGPLWHLIQPVLTTIMFLLIFGRIAGIPTDGIQPTLFYMSGITIWNYFAGCLINTSNTFVTNAPIFGKVYFPRLVLPFSVIISNIIRFGIQFLLLLVLIMYHHFNGYPMQVSASWLLIPVLVIFLAGIGLGLGLIISALTSKYRDFAILLTFAVQLGMYATPIAFPLSFLKEGSITRTIISANPISPLVECFRYLVFGKGYFSTEGIGYSLIFMVVVLFFGIIVFNKVERNFMDTV